MAEWQDQIPVVRVRAGYGEDAPLVYEGYAAQTDNGGALMIYEVESNLDGSLRRKPKGHTIVLANGTWETAECEWQAVAKKGLIEEAS